MQVILESMGPDPQTAGDVLYIITYYANELFFHFHNKHGMAILQRKFQNLEVEEYPPQAALNKEDQEELERL